MLPHPSGSGAVFVAEHLEMKSLRKYQSQLGTDLARLMLNFYPARMLIIFSFITTCYKSSDIYQIIFDTPFRLHLDNINKLEKETSEENKIGKSHNPTTVVKFGFPCTTCCGYIGQDNAWHDDWVVSVTSNVQCLATLLQSYY